MAKLADRRSETTPNQTPTHKSSIGGTSVDGLFSQPFGGPQTAQGPIPANFTSNQTINFADLKTPKKMGSKNQTSFLKDQNLYKTVNNKKFLVDEVKYDLQNYQQLDLKNIDYVIVSKLDNIFALPFITERLGFEGEVIMTLPMRQVGTEYLKEFVRINEQRTEKGNMVQGFKADGLGFDKNDGKLAEKISKFLKSQKNGRMSLIFIISAFQSTHFFLFKI